MRNVSNSEHVFGGDSSDSENEYNERNVPSSSRSTRPRGIMAHRFLTQHGAWIVDDHPTSPLRERGGVFKRRSGRRPGRGRGRGLHMQRLQEHSQIVGGLIEDDALFPTTEHHVKAVKKLHRSLRKVSYFMYY